MRSVADLIVARLQRAGVRCVFGMPGGGSNLDLVAACGRAGLPFVLTATETGGAIAALAQAETTRRPGACLTTLGPGVASAVNGIACASLERAPVIVFTDAPAGTAFEHQRLDHPALLAPVTKWSARIEPGNAAGVIDRAIACAMTEPRGPVHIDCPSTALACDLPDRREPADLPDLPDPRDLPDVPDIPDLPVRPLIIAGLGARDPAVSASIRRVCVSHRIPVLVTYKAMGVVADSDPCFAGVFTNGAIERPIVDQADLILTVGLDAVELLPRPLTFAQPVVDVPPRQVAAIADALRPSSWDLTDLRQMLARQRDAICLPAFGLAPHDVVRTVAAAARGSRVAVDAGAHMFPATMLWPAEEPNGVLISNGLSTMGFALPAAIGAALLQDRGDGAPRRSHVVALTGDGGLLICAGELATAVRTSARVIVIVFNDAALSLIDIKQRQRSLPSSGVDIGAIDWRALAESVGARGHAASSAVELRAAVAAALAYDGPSVIDVRVDAGRYGDIMRAVRG
jgi:acetolactate synthase-1/2/3 large subunit